MKISVLTLFPEMFESLKVSIIGRALEQDILSFNAVNIRDFSLDKHKRCDDYSFGGGAGMVMTAQPIFDAFNSIDKDRHAHRIYMSPKGKTLTHEKVIELSKYDNIILLCGHYEGIDQRVLDMCIDEEISIGDYVLTGGEIPAMVLIDAVARYIPNVLGSQASTDEESFTNGLLEYPQYTRPNIFNGSEVPEVLLSGHHANILKWRIEKAEQITKNNRPDLYEKYILGKDVSTKTKSKKK